MFCSNCGSKVSPNDNYCPVCGKNLKNVKVSIVDESNKKEEKQVNLNDSTKVFKPITNLDGIDTTDDIKNIIKAVDEKISQNISDYENKSISNDTYGPEKNSSKNPKIVKPSEKTAQKAEVLSKESNEKTDIAPDTVVDSIEEKSVPKKKRNLKEVWKDFINEDDDEFSIFSSTNEKKPLTKEEDIEISSSTEYTTSMENTLGIPKVAIEKALLESEKEDSKKSSDLKDKSSDESKKEQPVSYKSFTEQVNEELKKNKVEDSDSVKEDKDNFFSKITKKASQQKKKVKNEEKSEKNTLDNPNSKEDKLNSNIGEVKTTKNFSTTFKKHLLNLEEFINKKNIEILEKFSSYRADYTRVMLLICILLSSLPIIISMRRISISLFVLIILKNLFEIFKFYFSLNIATEKDWIETSDEEVVNYSLVNWMVCEAFLFIAFVFSPWDGLFSFSLLSSLMALPLATILLFIFATLISIGQYWGQLKDKSKVNFVAWYLIPFILFDFVSKIIFIIANLMI
ncbi:zinc-ribbon domain-containing protein [Anaerosphaera aminiphila DSM 21120]|uniref:Zinc-ribbon domain-containing protein n=1 Tax=Anaerosphaera aminiphila DSM 21120 TaxID=1120995 RepID=A0A1M5PEH6_9FIRM|nr:zinc ribbon domain-containing protein [Anaerosphaera aminiphila]SHG99919.1 zinc-ribbon domain-containing protein [Anaerosphaera aminiphila DSM 21120]